MNQVFSKHTNITNNSSIICNNIIITNNKSIEPSTKSIEPIIVIKSAKLIYLIK